ncbi:MAG TPA: restriction endonuclease subunit S [Terracidiphilus sp.]|jgi:type I restriction enzyme S subunit
MKWPKVAIGEICSLVNGRAFKEQDWSQSGLPIIRIQNLNGRGASFNHWPGPLGGQIIVKPKDLLLAWSGTPGTSFGAHIWEGPEGVLNQHIFRVDIDRTKIDPVWAMRSINNQLDHLISQAHGGVGLKHVTRGVVQEMTIPLPPLAEQRRITAILDKADHLRQMRRLTLQKLDSLTQSWFVCMFGDPARNPSGLPVVTLGDIVHSVSDGPHVSPRYSETGIPFLSTRNIRPGNIVWDDLKYITHEDAEVQWKKCRPQNGDVLYTKGGTTGLAVAIDFNEPIAVWVHVALIRPDTSKVDPTWLETALNSPHCYAQSQRYTHGIANRDLGLTRMTRIQMYLPALDDQRKFVRVRREINRLIARATASLSELDRGFASLQHRAFRGEL